MSLLLLFGSGVGSAESAVSARPLPNRHLVVFVYASTTLIDTWVDFVNDLQFSSRAVGLAGTVEQESVEFILPRRLGLADEPLEAGGTTSSMDLGNEVRIYVSSWRTLSNTQADAGVGGGREGTTAGAFSRHLWTGTIVSIGRGPDRYRVVANGAAALTLGSGKTHIWHPAMLTDYELEISTVQTGATYTGWAILSAENYDIDAIKVGDSVRIAPDRIFDPDSNVRDTSYEDQVLTVQSLEWSFDAVRVQFEVPFRDVTLEQIKKLKPFETDGDDNVFLNIAAGNDGSGAKVLAVGNATTAPTTNPTGGGILYAEGGAGKWRSSGGTTTTFGVADPHCPDCGRDFAVEWENDTYGSLAVCMWCLTEGTTRGIIRRDAGRSAHGR